MNLLVENADVWAASIPDRPGGLAEVLAILRDAGADLQFVIARRAPEEVGRGVVFLTPLQSDREIEAASLVGFSVTSRLHSVRVMGPDRPGILAEITAKIGDAGINLRGLSACVSGSQFVAYIAVDAREEADRAIALLAGT